MSRIIKKENRRGGKGTRVRFIDDLFRAGGGYCCDGWGDGESGGFGGDGGGGGGGGSDDEENDCVTAFFYYSMPLKRQFASAACFKILSKERHPRPHCRERCYARAHPLPTVFTVDIQLYVGGCCQLHSACECTFRTEIPRVGLVEEVDCEDGEDARDEDEDDERRVDGEHGCARARPALGIGGRSRGEGTKSFSFGKSKRALHPILLLCAYVRSGSSSSTSRV